MKLYLDVCCLNRPFDDQTQERIRLESEAVILILARLETGMWQWYSSEVVSDEIAQTPDVHRRERVAQIAAHAHTTYRLTDADLLRATRLTALGFTGMDALHLACAEACGVDCFLTTDDKLIRQAQRSATDVQVAVRNPLAWLLEQAGNV